jgi:carboxypeptidase C (cathepsin A)
MPESSDKPGASTPAPEPREQLVTTQHRLVLDNTTLEYTATCGTVLLRLYDENTDPKANDASSSTRSADKPRAAFFFIAYTLNNGEPRGSRAVTFSFNGGPGSSSVWLHLGLLGPQRVATDDTGLAPPPPYALRDNEYTLLTHSDLVFIDPVGTGHSRMLEAEKVTEFHEYQRDLDSVGEFIRLYLTRYDRWGSPKYLIGESYGTTRAAGLSHHLQEKHDVYLNGVMLVSLAIDLQTLSFDHANDLPYALFLPSYAATAWYHRALGPDMQRKALREVIAAAETFAHGDYNTALMQGSRLSTGERERIASQVARFTGLAIDYVLKCDLRPLDGRFCKELLRQRGQTVGRLDSRFVGQDRDDAGEQPEADAAMSNLAGAYAAGINMLLRQTLKFESDAPYVLHAPIWDKWKWKDFENKYVNVGASLRRAMLANPHMRVYVASGFYDLATPHAAGDYTLSHLGLRDAQAGNISVNYFEAGHMMYIHQPSLARMAMQLRAFVNADAK